MSKSHYIIEDVQSIYASINEETESIEEINNFAGDVYAAVATSMLHEGYSASGILGFLSTASDEEILERFGDYDENFIAESTISEEYVNEQVVQLDELVGAALRVLGGGLKAAKFAKGVKGLAPLSRVGQGLQGAGRALSRVAKQGPKASSVVRSGLSKLKSAAGAGLAKLKGAASKLPGAVGRVAKTLIPGAAGFALGRATSPKAEAPKSSGTPAAPAASKPAPAAPKPAAKTYAVGSEKMSKDQIKAKYDSLRSDPAKAKAFGDKAFSAVNPKLDAAAKERARTRGTSATTNPLMKDFKSSLPDPKPAKPTSGGVGTAGESVKSKDKSAGPGGYQLPSSAKPKTASVKRESYDIVLDYLLSEGHAETVEEAHYIMLRLEADHVQEIVEDRNRKPFSDAGEYPMRDAMRDAGMNRAPHAPVRKASTKKKPSSKNVA